MEYCIYSICATPLNYTALQHYSKSFSQLSVETGLDHPGHPGNILSGSDKIIRLWPRLDHVRCEIKKSTIRKCNNVSHTHFCSNNCLLQMHSEPHPLFLCAYVCNNHHLQLAEPRPLIHCCYRSSTSAVCQGILSCNHVQQTCSLREATSTYTSHILLSASLRYR